MAIVAAVVAGAGYLLMGNLLHSVATIVFGLPVILGITMMQKGWHAKRRNAQSANPENMAETADGSNLAQALILSLTYVCCGISFAIMAFLTAVYWPVPWTVLPVSTFIYLCSFACFRMALKEYKAITVKSRSNKANGPVSTVESNTTI